MYIKNSHIEELEKSLEYLNKFIAATLDKETTCSVFSKHPFNAHWNDVTLTEMKTQIRIYLTSWVRPGIEKIIESTKER